MWVETDRSIESRRGEKPQFAGLVAEIVGGVELVFQVIVVGHAGAEAGEAVDAAAADPFELVGYHSAQFLQFR